MVVLSTLLELVAALLPAAGSIPTSRCCGTGWMCRLTAGDRASSTLGNLACTRCGSDTSTGWHGPHLDDVLSAYRA